jgi:hypothetical protein
MVLHFVLCEVRSESNFYENTQADLAENSYEFLERSNNLQAYIQSNGKYLVPFKLLAKLDPVMQGHIVLVIKREVAVHCCGKNILK